MDYALAQVRSFTDEGIADTSEQFAPFTDYKQKRDFYADAFWTFAYSLFDIAAHAINVIHPMVTDESLVSFRRAANEYNNVNAWCRVAGGALPSPLLAELERIDKATRFVRLSAYRQCCLHRRAVCLRDTEQTVSDVYAETTPVTRLLLDTLVCDSVKDLRPKFTLTRRLEKECQTMRGLVEDSIRTVLSLI
jgi:hypothetical protein